MIDRSRGDITFECDSCAETLETETSAFGLAWTKAKSEGWTVRKIGTEWVHKCPNCH